MMCYFLLTILRNSEIHGKTKSGFLYELNESIVMPEEVVENIQRLKLIGENRFKDFLEKRVNSQQEALTDNIPQNNLLLFKKVLEAKKPTKSVKSVIYERKNSKLEWWTSLLPNKLEET